MNFQQRIENSINSKPKVDPIKQMNFVCVHEFNWTHKDLFDSPIPFVLDMLEQWNKMKEREAKANKKK
jgi:hypothetical protein